MKKFIRMAAACLLALTVVLTAAVPAAATDVIPLKPLKPIENVPQETKEAEAPIVLKPLEPKKTEPVKETQPKEEEKPTQLILKLLPKIIDFFTGEKPEETQPPEETQAETEPVRGEGEKKLGRALPGYPLYYQTDYPKVRYGHGTIATSGCGITSLAMVATYMTGHEYTPDMLARSFGGYDASNTDRMLNAATKLQLPWRMAKNWHDARDALEKGCPVIILENEKSKFTQSQHFIVAWEMTGDEKVLIHDSFEPNYEKWDMKKGFEEGFTQTEICAGYSGSWIFDIHSMPEDPFIYEEEEKPYIEPRYPGVTLTLEEEDLLARMVWVEARGESADGQQAVAEVVLNRLVRGEFPKTIRDVIYDEGQFRSVPFLDDADPNQTQYDAIERALYGPYVLPMDVVFFAQYAVNDKIWGEIGGHTFCYAYSEE